MNEERGAALRLLYQIKLAITKMQNAPSDEMTMTGIRNSIIEKKIQSVNELQATLPKMGGFKTMNNATKIQNVERKMLKFEYTKKLQDDKAWND
jgi:hypothetical protein